MRSIAAAAAILARCLADDAVNVSRVAAWAKERREERIRRWLPSSPFNRTGFRLVPVPPKLERGFLLVATRVEPPRHRQPESLVDFHTGGDEVARRTPAAERVDQ